VERRLKPAFMVMAIATASLTCLTLPTVRAVVATLPDSDAASTSPTGFQEAVRRGHAHFGDIAAEVASTYLAKLGASTEAARLGLKVSHATDGDSARNGPPPDRHKER